MLRIIKNPVLTEKTTRILELNNQHVFDVDNNLTKTQIRLLIEKIFLVKVVNVHTQRKRRVKRGITKDFKRAIVTLKKPEKIVFFS